MGDERDEAIEAKRGEEREDAIDAKRPSIGSAREDADGGHLDVIYAQ